MLAQLLPLNPQLAALDLSSNPGLPDRLAHPAFMGAATALTRLSLAGCARIAPGAYVALCCPGMADLDLSGTATTDADAEMLASCLPALRRLLLSRCIALTNVGLSALEQAPCVQEGRLRTLGVADLPRITAGGLAGLLTAWCRGSAAAGDAGGMDAWQAGQWRCTCSSGGEASGISGCGYCAPDAAGRACSGSRHTHLRSAALGAAGRPCIWLDLDASHLSALSDRVVADMALVLQLPQLHQPMRPLQVQQQQQCWPQGVDALEGMLQGMHLSTNAGSQLPVPLPDASGTGGSSSDMPPPPCLQFSRLLLGGCSQVHAPDLLHLADSGCLRQLRELDLSHMEALRDACGQGGVCPGSSARAAAMGASSSSTSTPTPTLAALSLHLGTSLLRLQLDGCHVGAAAAAALSAPAWQLQSLSLVGCKGLDNAALLALLGGCAASLTELSLGGASALWDEATALAPLTGLRALRLSRRPLLQDGALGPVLVANPGLTQLALAGCYHVTDALLAWAPQGLRQLSLAVCSEMVGTSVAQHCRRLQRLRLAGCEAVTVAAVQAIAVCCTQLQVLELPSQIPASWLPQQGPGGHLHGLRVVTSTLQ